MIDVAAFEERLLTRIRTTVVGQDDAARSMLVALLVEGHVLLEGVPGTAKTLLARSLAAALGLRFRRVQFTPDLMPSDILGTQIFEFQKGSFRFVEGPVFTNLLLADEINRAPAKTQAALLEAMQERQVTVDGNGRALPKPFLVVATQNPVEHQGTYPLPEAELDRFLFKIDVGYPTADQEESMLARHRGDAASLDGLLAAIDVVANADELAAAKEVVLTVKITPEVARYVVALVRATRSHSNVQLGGSPRAAVMLQAAARASAALEGRDYVIPDDVKRQFVPALRHRLRLTAAAEVEGFDTDRVLREIADAVAVPR